MTSVDRRAKYLLINTTDGTAIMQGVATVFIAQAYGIDVGIDGYLLVVLTATLASIGTAGVPGVGLVMLAMVLESARKDPMVETTSAS